MDLLVLGGTQFVGYYLVEAALSRGHTVTLFNRGQTNPDAFPGVEHLTGDRDGALEALKGRRWDVVVDTCGYVPRIVRDSAALLAGAVDLYVFVSTLSVYELPAVGQPPITEDSPMMTLHDESDETVTGETYGPLKALCERAAEVCLPGHVLAVRPGLIVGPRDPTGRFLYWVRRLVRGGEVLAPGNPGAPVQVIDARDLAAWMLDMAEARRAGAYNATGPAELLDMAGFLAGVQAAVNGSASLTWVSEEFLLEHEIQPFSELPIWLPDETSSLLRVDCGKAIDAGLRFRSLADTVRDTLAWDRAQSGGALGDLEGRLSARREADLLRAWRSR